MILVDSVYINQSGGKVLLEFFIDKLLEEEIEDSFFFIFDNRLISDRVLKLRENRYIHVGASESERRKAYKERTVSFEKVICFANVPPPISISDIPVFVFFQNVLILNSRRMHFKWSTSLKFSIKRYYIRAKNKSNYTWIVQTPSVRKMVIEKLRINSKNIHIIPFFQDKMALGDNRQFLVNSNKFLYVADGVEQKNHSKLLDAWKIVCENYQHNIELHLTIPDRFKKLINKIQNLKDQGYNIVNHGYCGQKQLSSLYSNCNYLIFPSLTESFGLPLIEAALSGCEIVSSDLPYVFDVVNPLRTFDPYDVSSIVKSIVYIIENPSERGTTVKIKNEVNKFLDLINK